MYDIIKTSELLYKRDFVFDVSQTEGDPIPQIAKLMNANDIGYDNLSVAISNVSKFPSFSSINSDKEQHLEKTIHEMAYSVLNQNSDNKSLEAESIAFVVCTRFGIDTSAYDFSNIGNTDIQSLKQSLDIIRTNAHNLIDNIDKELAEIQLSEHRLDKAPVEIQKEGDTEKTANIQPKTLPKTLEEKLSASHEKTTASINHIGQNKAERGEL